MKNIFTALVVAVFSISAFAKITVFTEQNAIDRVVNDRPLMSSIQHQTGGNFAGAKASSSQTKLGKSKFVVRVAFASNTPIGRRSCFVDVNVESKTQVIPGSHIVTSELVIKKVGTPICQK